MNYMQRSCRSGKLVYPDGKWVTWDWWGKYTLGGKHISLRSILAVVLQLQVKHLYFENIKIHNFYAIQAHQSYTFLKVIQRKGKKWNFKLLQCPGEKKKSNADTHTFVQHNLGILLSSTISQKSKRFTMTCEPYPQECWLFLQWSPGHSGPTHPLVPPPQERWRDISKHQNGQGKPFCPVALQWGRACCRRAGDGHKKMTNLQRVGWMAPLAWGGQPGHCRKLGPGGGRGKE